MTRSWERVNKQKEFQEKLKGEKMQELTKPVRVAAEMGEEEVKDQLDS